METIGLEPTTSGLQSRRSPSWATSPDSKAMPIAEFQLSIFKSETDNQKPQIAMGPGRLELPTSRLSGVRSSQLSYEPNAIFDLRFFDWRFQTRNRKLAIVKRQSNSARRYNYTIKKEQQKNRG